MNIYVGNLAWSVADKELRSTFEGYGQVASATVIKDKFTGQSRGFGFVEMPDNREAEAAINALSGKDLKGRAITVNEARPAKHLNVLNKTKGPKQTTPKPTRQRKIDQIAVELGVDLKTARHFMNKVRQIVGIYVKHSEILKVLNQIDNPKSATPQNVAALLPPRKPTSDKPIVPFSAPSSGEWNFLSSPNTTPDESATPPSSPVPEMQDSTPSTLPNLPVPKEEVKKPEPPPFNPVSMPSSLSFPFESDFRQTIQALFTELGLQLDQGKLRAKDTSFYPLPPDLINALAQGPNYVQGVADQLIAQAKFRQLVPLVVLLSLPEHSFKPQLPPQATISILNAIAISTAKDTPLLLGLLRQLVIYSHDPKCAFRFIQHVLLNFYFRANLVRDKSYMAHFDDSGRVVFNVLPTQNLTAFYTFATHSIWSLLWKLSSASLPHLLPDLGHQETWLSQVDMPASFQSFFNSGQANPQALTDYGRQCFTDLEKRRCYQIPSQGRAEIIASERLHRLTGLHVIRFVQEDVDPPGVFLQFEFGFDRPAIGLVKVEKNGRVEGFHTFWGSDETFKALIDAVALAYYRDLVTPGKIYYYRPHSRTPRPSLSLTPPRPKPLPRPQGVPVGSRYTRLVKGKIFDLGSWYDAQERARHNVTGHSRWIGHRFIADPEKYEEAAAAGVKLKPGETWVIEHERGGPGNGGLRLSHDGQLLERTLFRSSERDSASADLDKLLS